MLSITGHLLIVDNHPLPIYDVVFLFLFFVLHWNSCGKVWKPHMREVLVSHDGNFPIPSQPRLLLNKLEEVTSYTSLTHRGFNPEDCNNKDSA